ncbi:MAG: hypothetical protein NZ802_01760, partial [Candidatus Poseidoniales archaeon]|nr:hypothetical protein [Candidatus Poseidoniales archaeon]
MFAVISTSPTENRVTWVNLADNNQTDINSSSALRRDEAIWITGVGLNTTSSIEVVRENGTSYNPPITAYFTAADMDDNGTKLRLGKYAFNSTEADGYGSVTSKLKLTNLFGETIFTSIFNVNIQPNDGTAAENEVVLVDGMRVGAPYGITANLWDRTVTTGDDITFIGVGMKAIKTIEMEDISGASLTVPVTLELDPLGTPGVIVTDTLIMVDTSVAQFTDVNGSDSINSTAYRRFSLSSETQLNDVGALVENVTRNPVLTTAIDGQRFLVGRPPSVIDMKIVNAAGADVGDNNWNRDANATTADSNASIMGKGLVMMNRIEMLDGEGSVVAFSADVLLPVPAGHTGNANVGFTSNILDANDFTDRVELNASMWSTDGALLDSSVAGSRRIRITTPWGSAVTDDNASGTFTFSAAPDLAGADSNST